MPIRLREYNHVVLLFGRMSTSQELQYRRTLAAQGGDSKASRRELCAKFPERGRTRLDSCRQE
jgi:hypothetical protein